MNLSDEQKQNKNKYEYYKKEAKALKDWFCSLSLNLDKLIFGLSSGTIVLSVTFFQMIISSENIEYVYLLKISWFLLIITLIINVITHYSAMQGTKRSRFKLDSWFKSDKFKKPDLSTGWGKTADILNFISLITLTVGISLLAYFASLNINAITMDDKNKKIDQEKTTEKHAESAFENELTEQDMNTEPEDKPNNKDKE